MKINRSLLELISKIPHAPDRVQFLTVEDESLAMTVSVGLRTGAELADTVLEVIEDLRREAFHVSEDRWGWVWFSASDEDVVLEAVSRLPHGTVTRLHATFSFGTDVSLTRVA